MKRLITVYFLFFSNLSFSATSKIDHKISLLKNPNGTKENIEKIDLISIEKFEKMFMMDEKSAGLSVIFKKNALRLKEKAVPTLIKVMKESKYPIDNRWHATMLLARVMGAKSAPFIAKFNDHPHWMMRLASLKALLGLKQEKYLAVYSKALKDPSLIVRTQALDNIAKMQIEKLAPEVWNMMYDQANYTGENGTRKRTSIVKNIIRTLGDLKFTPAKRPLAKLIQKSKYQDLMDDLDYSLEKITGKTSPKSANERRKFWAHLTDDKSIKI